MSNDKRKKVQVKQDKKLEDLLQKILIANGMEKKLLMAILKRNYPDVEVPK